MTLRQDALDYHAKGRPGKVGITITKPCATQRDLALAYTPGVAEPVREIVSDPSAAFTYTAKGNLVAIVTNGTAVLGLGYVGPLAAKPVMEGKALLFKRFADIDTFDLEVEATAVDDMVRTVASLEPTFGGVNLEDVKAPECFEMEEKLRHRMRIPVFHDDQHGTAIVVAAALLNALELVGKPLDDVRIVFSGAGAAAIATARFLVTLGAQRERITMCDIEGVVFEGRTTLMDAYKAEFAADTPQRSLEGAMAGADVFIGLSAGGIVSGDMVRSMAPGPIVMALANPDPEIGYLDATAARPDAIVATGRSDTPNQVNNVLGFPFIFRGALDVQASAINDEMKIAACRALAGLAKQEVPDSVLQAYGLAELRFGPTYLLPKPLDPRVPIAVAPAVAGAAMASGAAFRSVDLDEYREDVARRLVRGREIMSIAIRKAQTAPKRVVFSEGQEFPIIRAAIALCREGIAHPVLLGHEDLINEEMARIGAPLPFSIVDIDRSPKRDEYANALYESRQRKGVTLREAHALLRDPNYFGAMMVQMGDVDAFVGGLTYHYPDVIRPALEVIGPAAGASRVAGVYLMLLDGRPYLLTDATVNIDPTATELADIAVMAADKALELGIEPRVAMLSFSSFGSTRHPRSQKVAEATAIVKQRRTDLMVEGEMMADVALSPELRLADYPFSALVGEANVLVFPSLEAANIAYKLLQHLAGGTLIGPILMGMAKPVHVLSRGADESAIVNMAAIAVVDAQELERRCSS
jgi:malate dehydrogenase (oxaloacetate-decarboxylating)(NADP+)